MPKTSYHTFTFPKASFITMATSGHNLAKTPELLYYNVGISDRLPRRIIRVHVEKQKDGENVDSVARMTSDGISGRCFSDQELDIEQCHPEELVLLVGEYLKTSYVQGQKAGDDEIPMPHLIPTTSDALVVVRKVSSSRETLHILHGKSASGLCRIGMLPQGSKIFYYSEWRTTTHKAVKERKAEWHKKIAEFCVEYMERYAVESGTVPKISNAPNSTDNLSFKDRVNAVVLDGLAMLKYTDDRGPLSVARNEVKRIFRKRDFSLGIEMHLSGRL